MWWKDCKNQSSISRDIRRNTAVFWPRHTWRSQMSPVNSGVTGPNFTKFSHDIQASYALLSRIARRWYCSSFYSSSAPNAGGVSQRWYIFAYYLVAMAMSLDKLEKKLQIHHLHICPFIWCKDCENQSSRSRDITLNRSIFGRVIPDIHKWDLSTLDLLNRISGNFHTIYRHQLRC